MVLKIQYPGVARSIESDVDNLLRIITYANFLPKGLYVEARRQGEGPLSPVAVAGHTPAMRQ